MHGHTNDFRSLFQNFFSVAPQSISGLRRLIVDVSRSYTDTHTRARERGRIPLDDCSARRRGRYLHNTQERNIHAFSGIWTRDPSKQAAADRTATGIGISLLSYVYSGMTHSIQRANSTDTRAGCLPYRSVYVYPCTRLYGSTLLIRKVAHIVAKQDTYSNVKHHATEFDGNFSG